MSRPGTRVGIRVDDGASTDASALSPRDLSPTPDSLEEAFARYRAVVASTLDPVITIDSFGIIQSA